MGTSMRGGQAQTLSLHQTVWMHYQGLEVFIRKQGNEGGVVGAPGPGAINRRIKAVRRCLAEVFHHCLNRTTKSCLRRGQKLLTIPI